MKALEFDFVNHNGIEYHYRVIPLSLAWERCKCFPGEPEREAWVLKAMVLERNDEKRNVVRNFALVKMRKVSEVDL